jgi:hypothetical protein
MGVAGGGWGPCCDSRAWWVCDRTISSGSYWSMGWLVRNAATAVPFLHDPDCVRVVPCDDLLDVAAEVEVMSLGNDSGIEWFMWYFQCFGDRSPEISFPVVLFFSHFPKTQIWVFMKLSIHMNWNSQAILHPICELRDQIRDECDFRDDITKSTFPLLHSLILQRMDFIQTLFPHLRRFTIQAKCILTKKTNSHSPNECLQL